MHLLRPFLADNRGVVAIVVGLMSAILLPAVVTAYYFVQLSTSKDILTTVCQRVLAAYVEAEDTAARAPAMATVITGLVGDEVLKDITTDITLVSGTEMFAKGDAEANRPTFELALQGTDVAAQDSDLGGIVGTKCKAKLAFKQEVGLVEHTRELQVIAGRPPADVSPNWGEGATANAIKLDLRAYMTQTITNEAGSNTTLHAEIWKRDDGLKAWSFPTTSNLRMSGNFAASDAALRLRIRPTYFVNLMPKDLNKISITPNDSSAPIGYPAIRPRCYDNDADDDGFGWEPDPALLPSGTGPGTMGSLAHSTHDYDHKYIALVGVDRQGKYGTRISDDTWDNLKNWQFRYSSDGGTSLKTISSAPTFPGEAPFISFRLSVNNASSSGYWEYKTEASKSAGGVAQTYRGEIIAKLYKYKLTMKIDCPGTVNVRTALPVRE